MECRCTLGLTYVSGLHAPVQPANNKALSDTVRLPIFGNIRLMERKPGRWGLEGASAYKSNTDTQSRRGTTHGIFAEVASYLAHDGFS
jgi:hypothetical protein